MIKTKIIATLGPSTDSEIVLRKMIIAGLDVVRLNFSHSNWEEHLKRVLTLPDPTGNRTSIKRWKEIIWHRRKKHILPEIEEVRTIWKDYVRLAKNV